MEKLTRRLFLRNTAAAGAVGATVAAPAVAAEPEMTPREKVIWHMREIERLALGTGALDAHITVVSCYNEYVAGKPHDVRLFGIHHKGFLLDSDGMFG